MRNNRKLPVRGLATSLSMALSLALFTPAGSAMAQNTQHQTALVGTWTSVPDAPAVQKPAHASEGLYRLQMNSDGTLTPLDVIKMKSPSWIVKSRDGRFAYITNEENAGTVTALAIDAAGAVRVLNVVNSHGQQPTHATLSPDGRFLFVSNYSVAKGGAGVAVFPVHADGSLGEQVQSFAFDQGSGVVKTRQESGHAHATVFTPDGSYLYAADLGDDRLHAWRYDASQAQPLQPDPSREVRFAPGSGPRHMVFSRDGQHAWVILEMAGELAALKVSDNRLTLAGQVKLYGDRNSTEYKSGGGIILSPDGHYLIVSNRGADNQLLVFRIGADGRLGTPKRYAADGIEPRAFSFDDSGKYLYVANVFSNTITLFDFDPSNGELKARGPAASIATPTDIKFFN